MVEIIEIALFFRIPIQMFCLLINIFPMSSQFLDDLLFITKELYRTFPLFLFHRREEINACSIERKTIRKILIRKEKNSILEKSRKQDVRNKTGLSVSFSRKNQYYQVPLLK